MGDTEGARAGVTRRSVIHAAWSIPVVIAAGATPAYASSPQASVQIFGPSPLGAPEFQTITLRFSDLPEIPPGDEDTPGNFFVEFCMPEGVGVFSVSSDPVLLWATNPETTDYQPGGTLVWNLSTIAQGDLDVFVVVRNDTGAPLAGEIEVDVFILDVLDPVIEVVPFEFGTDPVLFRTCSS